MDDADSAASQPSAEDASLLRTSGTVLYVEDHDDTRIAITHVLTAAGFEVVAAESAERAVVVARPVRDRLDALIVDYHLNDEKTGTEVAEEIGSRLGHGVPIVILTGDPANAEIPWLRNSPVWLVRKPADPNTLIAGLLPLIEFSRAMRRVSAR